MNLLEQNIRSIKGIGEKKAQAINGLGVFSLSDLLSYFPRRYEDRSQVKPIALVQDGEAACICAVAANEPVLSRVRRGLDIVRFRAYDDSCQVDISYFNQPYVRNQIHRGESYRFYGKMEWQGRRRCLTNPIFEKEESVSPLSSTGQIVPVYRVCKGITQKNIRQSIRTALDVCAGEIPDPLPEEILREERLTDAATAYEAIHFPQSPEALAPARRRFVFEELFLLSCALGMKKGEARKGIPLPLPDFEDFYQKLPFTPTVAQRKAVAEAAEDLSSGQRMSRLLQGDVGSGKTLVAAALVWQCTRAGYLSAFMAPTEILAEQHYHTLSGFLEPFGCRIALLTGSMRVTEKRSVYQKLEQGELDLIIGTHALLSEGIHYPRLALAITDEQHRFGVAQRSRLSSAGDLEPHIYVMSATPIPRTLALIIYGDLSVSILDELPAGRQKVDTFSVSSAYHERLLSFIRKLCGEGRQVFVVCPRVEEEEDGEETAFSPTVTSPMRNAVDYAKQLQEELPELRVACLHGKMKAAEKDRVMQQFLNGDTDVLVSTTVIEVGVDVPNAALMLIENADRFGLSQLHQLRGRVGRGNHKSYCVLVSDSSSEDAKARLKVLCDTNDGFKIAEEDLRMRGPGDFFGNRQHGLPEMHVADLGTDTETLMRSKKAADRLLEQDPLLQQAAHQALYKRVSRLLEKTQGSFN